MEKTNINLSQDLIQNTIEKMKDPTEVKDFVLDPNNSHPNALVPISSMWHDLSLASGYPSFLLLFAKLQTIGLVKEDIVHKYVVKIKECIETEGLFDLSLYSGLAGIAFAIQYASFQGKRYQKMINTLHISLSERVKKVYFDQLKMPSPFSSQIYDVIQGLAGIGRYILENLSHSNFYKLAKNIADFFVKLTQPLCIDGYTVPGWFLSPKDILNRRNKKDLKGNFNLGLAHGIPGILSFFAVALMRGVEVDGQKDAMQRIISWLRSKSIFNNDMIRWPYSISWEEETLKKVNHNPCRDAWCYGVPGMARTLFLAGKALGNNELKSFAIKAFRGVFLFRKREDWDLPGPMLCHGIAGLLMITNEMAKETECADLSAQVFELKQLLLSSYQPDAPFGFKDIEISTQGNQIEISKPGFLEGSAGLLLALLVEPESSPKWSLPLMIYD